MTSITKKIGKWTVALKEQPHNNRWRCEIGDGWGQVTFSEASSAEWAIKQAAQLVSANASDWLEAFGVE